MSKLQWMRQVLVPSLAVLKKVLAGAIAYTASIKHLMLGHNLKVPRISCRSVCHWVFFWHLWRLKCSKASYRYIQQYSESRVQKYRIIVALFSGLAPTCPVWFVFARSLICHLKLTSLLNAFQMASLWFLLFYFLEFISAETLLAEVIIFSIRITFHHISFYSYHSAHPRRNIFCSPIQPLLLQIHLPWTLVRTGVQKLETESESDPWLRDQNVDVK